MHRSISHEDFAKRGLRTTQDPLGALQFDPDDNPVRKDVAVKKAVDRLNSQKVTSYAEVATIVGVPQNVYLEYIRNEIDTEHNFLQLPWTILLLLSFTVLSMGLLQQEVEFAMQEAYERDIHENANFAWSGEFGHRGLTNVTSIAQFWSWMRLGLLPTLVRTGWMYSEPAPAVLGATTPSSNVSALPRSWLFRDYRTAAPVPNEYLHYSKLVGGIRLRQIAAEQGECKIPSLTDPTLFAAWLGKPCTPSSLGDLSPERPSAQLFSGFSRTQYLLPGVDTLQDMQRTVLDMEDGCNYAHSRGDLASCLCDWCKAEPRQPWLDEQTARVEVSYVVYNAGYGLYTYVSINFLFNRGGHVYPFVNMISCFQDPMTTPLETLIPTAVAIGIWLVLQLKLLVDEIRDAIRTARASKHGFWQGLLRDYLRFWNAVDWVSIAVAAMVIVFWLNVRTQVEVVNGLLPSVVRATLYPSPEAGTVQEQRLQYQPTADTWFAAAEQMVLANSACIVIIILYPLVIMLRLFKSFQAQPRLAIVTETIKTAVPDLAHFFVVALCIFGCLFVNSIVIFGQDLEAFSTIPRAFNFCLAAVLGQWHWESLKEVGYMNAATWLWIFSIVMSLIFLNMLLAIVLDSYAYEKEKASELKTLLQQLWEVIRRRQQRRRGQRVNLQEIWDAFLVEFNNDVKSMMVNRTLITPDSLMNSVPQIPEQQALRTLANALQRQERLEIGHLTEEELKRELHKGLDDMSDRIQEVCRDVELVAEKLDYFERLQAPGDATYDFYFSGEHASQDKASKAWISKMVSELSSDLKHTFHNGLHRYHVWQDHIENGQTELHESIADMQNLVQRHTGLVQDMTQAVESLLEPYQGQVGSGVSESSAMPGATS